MRSPGSKQAGRAEISPVDGGGAQEFQGIVVRSSDRDPLGGELARGEHGDARSHFKRSCSTDDDETDGA